VRHAKKADDRKLDTSGNVCRPGVIDLRSARACQCRLSGTLCAPDIQLSSGASCDRYARSGSLLDIRIAELAAWNLPSE